MSLRTSPPFRADHVGSLLRPPELHEAREAHAAGKLDDEGLKAAEDAAIDEVVRMQEEVGLQSVTDGEFRRATWHMDFIYSIDGISKAPGNLAVKFHNAEGDIEWTPAAHPHRRQARRLRADLRRGVRVPAVGRERRPDAEAHDPVAEHGPLPRRPRRRSTRTSTPRWTSSGPT